MGANSGANGGGEGPANRYQKPPKPKKIKVPSLVGSLVEGLKSQKKAADQNMLDYEGEAAGVTRRRTNYDAMREAQNLDRGGGGGQAMQSPTVSSPGVTTIITPTKAEVSQSQAADAYDARKTKARGRSTTIMTGPRGVEEETLTLSKKSLLGK